VDLDGLGVVEPLRRLVRVRQPPADAARRQERVDLALPRAPTVVGELLEQPSPAVAVAAPPTGGCRSRTRCRPSPS
jgi:hypothetical protein